MTLGDELERGRRCADRWRSRRGLEQRLHDGPALRLSALSLRVGLLRSGQRDSAWEQGLDEVADEIGAALQELREVAAAIYPPLLDEAGLGPALRELVSASGACARIDAVATRCGTAAEGAAYFATAACLAQAGGGDMTVRVRVDGGDLVLTLEGVDPALRDVVLDEAGPLGGSVTVADSTNQTTTITGRFPCV
ncbi:histidine kinase [Actinomycetospora chlora]|uniref:Histidine kinase n=1 Tax=Actinomycetospora chlora TaxID=663608 RepID=A0ABP9AD57_9PSEU